MRLSFFSLGMLLALTLIVTGCSGGDQKKPAAKEPTPPGATTEPSHVDTTTPQNTSVTLHPAQEAVRQFLSAMVREDTRTAFALFTPKAQEEYQKTGSALDPEVFQGMTFRITGGDEMKDAGVGFYAVYVDMVNEGELIDAVWGIRKIGSEYRIANLMMSFDGDVMALDFEDPAGTRNALPGDFFDQQASTNQVPTNNRPITPQNPQQMARPNTTNIQ